MRFALLLAALIPLSQAGAADKYLDCDCALDGDGTADSCAASGGGAGAWNTPASLSLSPGDTLTGSGTCYARMSITGGSAGNVVTYAAPEGVTLDSSVSVDGSSTFTANTPLRSTEAARHGNWCLARCTKRAARSSGTCCVRMASV